MQQSVKPQFPASVKDLKYFSWDNPDIIIISGDAFIDHPAFGAAVIARVLENNGFKVAIVPQPNWKDDLRDFKKFGRPNLFFAVTAGNMDSMINHYTANKRLRSDDAYTPGGKAGFRPDRASIVYTKILKSIFPDTPVVLGGVEASLRRLTHYDYWEDKLFPSVLISSGADFLCYGMAEKSISDLALNILQKGHIYDAYDIRQIAYVSDFNDNKKDDINLKSHESCLKNKEDFAENFVIIEKESNKLNSNSRITQISGDKKIIVNPPYHLMSENELDEIYSLPFTRLPHPKYNKKGSIPAYEMIKNSVTIHRGCFGACSFCTISAHQGKFVSSRSEKSVSEEISKIAEDKNFKGHISDVGGPTANMYKMKGINLDICEKCNRNSCVFPDLCKNLDNSHKNLTLLYRNLRKIKGVNKITIGSGIRYDLFVKNTGNQKTEKENREYFEELLKFHVSGRLKVAPEHTSDKVLKVMRKPSFKLFSEFRQNFYRINKKYDLNQQLVPYFISAHPGCTENDMRELSEKRNELGFTTEQVQGFTPTPMTLSSVMFYTGMDPYTKKPLYVARSIEERKEQLSYFFRK